jgi:hypothetical protein
MEHILQHQGISTFNISLSALGFKLYRSNTNAAVTSKGAVLEVAIGGE